MNDKTGEGAINKILSSLQKRSQHLIGMMKSSIKA
jgi:hypothetical protein